MKFEKTLSYAGFTVVIKKETQADPYRLTLDCIEHTQPYLIDALRKTEWTMDPLQFMLGKALWMQELTGPTQTVLLRETYAHLENLHRTRKMIESEELSKEEEVIYGKLQEGS